MAGGKGSRKRKISQFKEGHTLNGCRPLDPYEVPIPGGRLPSIRPVYGRDANGRPIFTPKNAQKEGNAKKVTKRLSKDKYDKVVKKGKFADLPVSIPAADGTQGSARILRPKVKAAKKITPKRKGNPVRSSWKSRMAVDKNKLEELINIVVRGHHETDCENPNLQFHRYLPWGGGVRAAMKCTNCTFQQKKLHKLYKTVKKDGPGPKAAKCNISLHVGMQESTVGPTKTRQLFAAADQMVGSRSGLQKNANKVADETVKLVEQDICDKVEEIKDVMEARGLGRDAPIAASFDGRYDGARMKSDRHPGHGASLGIGVVTENMTDQKYVIGVAVENKLCQKGALLRKAGKKVTCPGTDHECSATIQYCDNISERRMAQSIGSNLVSKHNVKVSHLTTDSDAQGPLGMEAAMREHDPEWVVERSKDLVHLGTSQRRYIQNAKFSVNAFGEGRSYKDRVKCQQALAHDVEERCALTLTAMHMYYKGNRDKIIDSMPTVVHYMMRCYQGDHSACRNAKLAQFTCRGRRNQNWCLKLSAHLTQKNITYLNFNDSDRCILLEAINKKLGADSLIHVVDMRSTQKCEAVNSALSAGLPKTRRHSRNAKARALASVHRINNGPEKSMEAKLKHLNCGMEGSESVEVFADQQRVYDYNRSYAHRPSVQKHKMKKRKSVLKQYYEKNQDEEEYKKFAYDEARERRDEVENRSKIAVAREQSKQSTSTITSSMVEPHQSELVVESRADVRTARRSLKAFNKKKEMIREEQSQRMSQAQQEFQKKKSKYYGKGSKKSQSLRSEHCYSLPISI